MMKKKLTLIMMLFMLLFTTVKAQESLNDYSMQDLYDMSLEDLMNLTVDVASQNATSLRETPGIVTVITEDELRNSGARTLIDALRLVPGLDFAADVENTIGLGVRGNYGLEGKVLILVDGIQMNETYYGSFTFGDHLPLDNIKKIEVIRGPGSAIYGGMAELAVISITTKDGQNLKGARATANYGLTKEGTLRNNIQASYGQLYANGLDVSVSGYFGKSNLSNRTIENEYGATINYQDSSEMTSTHVNFGLGYKGLKARYIHDDFTTDVSGSDDKGARRTVKGNFASLSYDYEATSKLKVSPKVSWKRQLPWNTTHDGIGEDTFAQFTTRYQGNLTANYSFTEKINVIGGAEYFYDNAYYVNEEEIKKLHPTLALEDTLKFHNYAFYAEAVANLNLANFTLGARYDNNSKFGNAFVPRLAVTKANNWYHVKFLWSKAFKTPVIANYELNYQIKPERTRVVELEAGARITSNMALTFNIFDTKIEDPIVFYFLYDQDNYHSVYSNFEKTGSRGFEADYRLKGKWGYATLGYSFYKSHKNKVGIYTIANNDKAKLGFPQHKITLMSSIRATENLSINPTLSYYSKRYMNVDIDASAHGLREYDPALLANLFVKYENLFTNGFSLSVGVYDILGENYTFIIPFAVGDETTPDTGREFMIRASYKLGL